MNFREIGQKPPRKYRNMNMGLLSLVLPDNRVSKITHPCPFCNRKYERTSGFFGLCIHSSSVLKILPDRLGLCKICAHWVPYLLTDEQKQSWVRLASHVIEKYDKCDPRHLEEIVTGDETWIYHFQPDSKAENKVRVSSEGDRPAIACRCKTSNRMLYAIFFDSKGPVL